MNGEAFWDFQLLLFFLFFLCKISQANPKKKKYLQNFFTFFTFLERFYTHCFSTFPLYLSLQEGITLNTKKITKWKHRMKYPRRLRWS